MLDEATVAPGGREAGETLLQRSLHLTREVARTLELKDLHTGRWFTKLVDLFLRHYEAHGLHVEPEAAGPRADVTGDIIRRACVASALSGSGVASVSTGVTALAAESGPLGMFVAVPVAGLSVGAEMMVRAIIHLRMTCDLGSAFGVRFQADEPDNLSRLYTLILGEKEEEEDEDGDELGLGRVVQVMRTESGKLGADLGERLLGESVARNFLPFLNVVTSTVTNWRHTRYVGEAVLRYVRMRRALEDGDAALRARSANEANLLLESAWFLFVADGRLREEESAVLAQRLSRLSQAERRRLRDRFVEDESEWLKRLRRVSPQARGVFLEALKLLAAADLKAPPPVRATLERAADALGGRVDKRHLESLMHDFRHKGVARMPLPEPREVPRARQARAPRPRTAEASGMVVQGPKGARPPRHHSEGAGLPH